MPREAVSNGCCIITGRLGASFFFEDVPLEDEYKFDVKDQNIPRIVKEINHVLENYGVCKHDFDFYRTRVKQEQSVFYQEIDNIFN